ncbi:hypothetical protein LSTR_LSTR004556 [Laodelphax striatellus]|uniref:tRNA-splicing endonuclease subunit Sen2 n=1 Tax=Laodelphax striatellus TaxID=195883 RepID=A0A482WTS0_LAOST|nr:hypothetical protein LSTR_LSTR004556 [Laodelphax striatellus]
MDLKEPKRKRFNRDQSFVRLPLPVLIEDVSGIAARKSLWPMNVGTFNGDCVIISNQDEVSALYNAGYFGKGCYSRGFPCFDKNKAGSPPVLQKRQWNRRLSWMKKLSPSAVDGIVNESDNNKQDAGKSRHETTHSMSEQETHQLISDESEIDEIVISDEDVEKSKESTSRKRNNEVRSDSRPNKHARFSDESQPPEAIAGSSSKPIELSEDSDSRSKTCDVENNQQSSEVDDQNIPADSVIVINDVIDYDKCDFEPRLCVEPLKTVRETLNLSLEEAFFLSYALGCLHVVNLDGTFMTLTEMWQTYKHTKPTFVSSFIVYLHFRSKGWVVKSGLKYGGDFLLYKKGPKFYHASYIVVIEDVGQPSSESDVARKPLDWTKFLTLQRIAETVSKDVLICHVQWPTKINTILFETPEVVSQFKIQEVIYRRWNSKKNVQETTL